MRDRIYYLIYGRQQRIRSRYFATTVIVGILLFIMVSFPVYAQSSYIVTENAPVYPGETIYVYVPIQNMGFDTIMNSASVKLVPKDDLAAKAVTLLDDTYSFGDINDWGNQRTAQFRIHINPDTVEGDYYFNVFINYTQTTGGTVSYEIYDQLLTIKGKPLIVLLNSSLGMVSPMSITNVSIQFKNEGTGTVQNALAEINISRSDAAFSILGGGNQFYLGNLKAGDEADITFTLAVDIATIPGVYNFPVRIVGSDNYSSENFVGLIVAGTTDFEISYQETSSQFSLNVANVGISPANAVSVSIPQQKNFSVIGSRSSVLGNLNPGDYTSAIFQITKNTNETKTTYENGNTLEVLIQYTDTSGQRHSITKYIDVQLVPTRSQSTGISTNYMIFIVVVFILVIYFARGRISTYYKNKEEPKGSQ